MVVIDWRCVDGVRAEEGPYAMHAVTFSQARADLESLIERAVNDCQPIAITRCRGEGAVLVSESYWASIERVLNAPVATERR